MKILDNIAALKKRGLLDSSVWAILNGRTATHEYDAAPQIGDSQLTPEQEAQYFLQWKPQHSPRDSGYDYDNRGAFLADQAGTLPPRDARGHGTDQFKKPWHPTYSTGSAIPPPDGLSPGVWGKSPDGRVMFTPGSANMAYHSRDELEKYFRTVEPNAILNWPNE